MTVEITLSRLPDSSSQLSGFTQFWLRYVHGFSPHFHCQRSLRGVNDPRFRKGMNIGRSFELKSPDTYQYIYLCGVTARKYPGLHLALLPERNATAQDVTYNGIEISVTGARKLDIPNLPDGFADMSRAYTTCRNWQFGIEYYGLVNMRRELVQE